MDNNNNNYIVKELPVKYYLEHFQYLLSFLEKRYLHLLVKKEKRFIKNFRSLTEDAQCLYIRLVNRKSQFFKISGIKYDEIKNIRKSLKELSKNKFIQFIKDDEIYYLKEVLTIHNKVDLINIIKELKRYDNSLNKLTKEDLIREICRIIDLSKLLKSILEKNNIINILFKQEVKILQFIFFGNLEVNMSQFVIKDIGNAFFEEFDEASFSPIFQNRKEVNQKLQALDIYEEFKKLREELTIINLYEWFKNKEKDFKKTYSENVQQTYDKLFKKLGFKLEKEKLLDLALEVYSFCKSDLCRERIVRIYLRQKKKDLVIKLCDEILNNPQDQEEYIFAQDFKERVLKKSRKSTTTLLKKAETILISNSFENHVENGVLNFFEKHGHQGFFSENYLWNSLFGLIFWDILFEKVKHNPFQRAPSDLYINTFFINKQEEFNKRINEILDKDILFSIVERRYFEKYGIANSFVSWNNHLFEFVSKVIEKLAPLQLVIILKEMMKNLKSNTRGFPDLFIWDNENYFFIEVKSPNDKLSAQQLFWLEYFGKNNINAKVLRVKFT